jgi:hypothetical protein
MAGLAFFDAAGHGTEPLWLRISPPLFDEVVSYDFQIG